MDKTQKNKVAVLRAHIDSMPPHVPEFMKGTAVLLDNGCVGVVVSDTDDEGSTSVCYIDEAGSIQGPSFGWELNRL